MGSHADKPVPHYVNSAEVARYLEVTRSAVNNWTQRHATAPKPDATYSYRGEVAPLWLESRLPEWAAWRLETTAPKWVQALAAQNRGS